LLFASLRWIASHALKIGEIDVNMSKLYFNEGEGVEG
jgi:hypothetical protein